MDSKQKGIIGFVLGSLVLVCGVFLFMYKPPVQVPEVAGILLESPFSNGQDWERIAAMPVDKDVKDTIFSNVLKITIESSSLSGNPLRNPSIPIAYYKSYMDNFYKLNENKPFPIFFAFRIADMAANGADSDTLSNFTMLVKEKLKELGLISN